MLLKQHKHLFCKDSIFFVGIHEEFLMDCLLLAKQTFEPNAVMLIKMTLEFLVELVKYNNEWKMENSQSLQNVMVGFVTFFCYVCYIFINLLEMRPNLDGTLCVFNVSPENLKTADRAFENNTGGRSFRSPSD